MRISSCVVLLLSMGLVLRSDSSAPAHLQGSLKGAVVSGRVRDPAGKPVVDAVVAGVRRVNSMEGLPVIVGAGGEVVQTDDRGAFRVFGLPPGEYLILAKYSNRRVSFDSMSFNKTILAPTFFPSTRDLLSAKPIVVGVGQEVAGIEITMVSTAGFTVSGRVVDSKQAPVRTAVTLHIFPSLTPHSAMNGLYATPDLGPDQWSSGIYSNQDGTFSIGEVPSGSYELFAAPPMEWRQSPGAAMRLTIDKDLTGLQLVIPAPQ